MNCAWINDISLNPGIVFFKFLDVIILVKEGSNVQEEEEWFTTWLYESTSVCTAMVVETVSYYVNNGSHTCTWFNARYRYLIV